jgi:hypothetical protein
VAEMVGPVDFNKNMNFWQQDKWNGFFPVKWHIIKDVPNPQFRHIILENNENKPVTNSRDTQEVLQPLHHMTKSILVLLQLAFRAVLVNCHLLNLKDPNKFFGIEVSCCLPSLFFSLEKQIILSVTLKKIK